MTKVAAVTSKSAQRLLEFQQNNGYLNDVRLESFGFFLDDYVIYGGDLTFDKVDVYKVLLSESIISLNDQLWRAFIKEFRITKHNTTYYVGFLDEKGYVFGETEPFENYLRLWTIPVDANGNIGSPIDHRSLFGYLKFKAKYNGVYLNVDEVNEAINNANIAANNANQAASDVQGAVDAANDAANQAKDAVLETEVAIEGVNSYLGQLGQVITNANAVIGGAIEATENASEAAQMAAAAAGNANQVIQDVENATQNALSLMQGYVSQLRPEDEYDNEKQYYTNNIVTFYGSSFIARQNTKGNPPPARPVISNAHWQLIASQGLRGERGPAGQDGKDGTGINPLGELQSEDELPSNGLPGDMYMIHGDMYVWQENTSSWKNAGPIQGPEGKSAYVLAVENGFVGTLEEWLESLKGEMGPPGSEGPRGPAGQDGKDGAGINPLGELQSEDELPPNGLPGDMYMIHGDMYVWQENTRSWKNVGPIQGPEGKSAYTIAMENGFVGTEAEWLTSLIGPRGERGEKGETGDPGADADLTEINQKVDDLQTEVTEHLGQMVLSEDGAHGIRYFNDELAVKDDQEQWVAVETGGSGEVYQESIIRNEKSNAIGIGTFADSTLAVSRIGGKNDTGKFFVALNPAGFAIGDNVKLKYRNSPELLDAKVTNITDASDGMKNFFLETTATLNNDLQLVVKLGGNVSYQTAMGEYTFSSGRGALAEGLATIAIGEHSHAEGSGGVASGYASHSQGTASIASGHSSFAGGQSSTSEGDMSFAFGQSAIAKGRNGVALGSSTKATGDNSFAANANAEAIGTHSAAIGMYTTANDFASVAIGRQNKAMTGSPTSWSTSNTAFLIGNGQGTLSNAFRVMFNGNTYGFGAWNSTGADYAEFFEWSDGNFNDEDRVGFVVTLDGDKIRKATVDDKYILGIISANPSVIGDSYQDDWNDKYVVDEWGRIQHHYVDLPYETGEYDKGIPITELRKSYVPIISPNWDSTKEYVPREKRKEWSPVGLMGKLLVRDDGTCEVNSYAKISADEGTLTASDERTEMRVIERVAPTIVKVFIK